MNKEAVLMNNFRNIFNKIALLNKEKMEKALQGYKPSEVHCIEAISMIEHPNVKKLSEDLLMTRGAISKLTKRLQQRDLIEDYRLPHNKKEIYFKLTEKGQEVQRIHHDLHHEFEQRDQAVFDAMTDEEYNQLLRFIERYQTHLDNEIEERRLIR